jgi:hypothetical protein
MEIYAVDSERMERFKFPEDLSRPLPERSLAPRELDLEAEIPAWLAEEQSLWRETMTLRETSLLLSKRYFAGEELLFPRAICRLGIIEHSVAGLHEPYLSVLSHRPPPSDEGLVYFMARQPREEDRVTTTAEALSETSPEIQAAARRLAQHFVVMARAAALVTLGEREAGADTIQAWVRLQRDQRAQA